MSENRKHPRKPIQLAAAFQTGDGPRLHGTCSDMSLGGVFIETDAPAAFGATVRVFVKLPGLKEETVITGVVRWTKPTGMGVQFGVMGARETHAMMQLLS